MFVNGKNHWPASGRSASVQERTTKNYNGAKKLDHYYFHTNVGKVPLCPRKRLDHIKGLRCKTKRFLLGPNERSTSCPAMDVLSRRPSNKLTRWRLLSRTDKQHPSVVRWNSKRVPKSSPFACRMLQNSPCRLACSSLLPIAPSKLPKWWKHGGMTTSKPRYGATEW